MVVLEEAELTVMRVVLVVEHLHGDLALELLLLVQVVRLPLAQEQLVMQMLVVTRPSTPTRGVEVGQEQLELQVLQQLAEMVVLEGQ
jgi:hypothetical protein